MKKVTVRDKTKVRITNQLSLDNKIGNVLWETARREEGSKHTYVDVICTKCHETNCVSLSHLVKSSFLCKGCLNIKYKDFCDKLNLKFIGKYFDIDTTYVKTECNICKTHSNISVGQLRLGFYRCETCLMNKYKSALLNKFCTLISTEKLPGKDILIHYINKDGVTFKAYNTNVLKGKFEVSLNGRWVQPHSTYLIKLQVEGDLFIYKIGTANDPIRRAKSLKLNKNYEVFTLASFEDRFGADKLESELHTEFSEYRLCRTEAEKHTDSNVLRKNKTGQYHRVKDGITEWFSSEVFNILSQRYSLE